MQIHTYIRTYYCCNECHYLDIRECEYSLHHSYYIVHTIYILMQFLYLNFYVSIKT